MLKMIIRYTKHAIRRMEDLCLTTEFVEEKIIGEGGKIRQGRTKVKFVFRQKNKLWIAICAEIENELTVITIVETHDT